ncbi:hypothetical protein [Bacillus sp. LK2]|nr:hypothetical protein [Bacillus sp. LK2]
MKNTFSSDCEFTKIDYEAKPASTLTAFGSVDVRAAALTVVQIG